MKSSTKLVIASLVGMAACLAGAWASGPVPTTDPADAVFPAKTLPGPFLFLAEYETGHVGVMVYPIAPGSTIYSGMVAGIGTAAIEFSAPLNPGGSWAASGVVQGNGKTLVLPRTLLIGAAGYAGTCDGTRPAAFYLTEPK